MHPQISRHAFIDTHTADKEHGEYKKQEARGAGSHELYGLKMGGMQLYG